MKVTPPTYSRWPQELAMASNLLAHPGMLTWGVGRILGATTTLHIMYLQHTCSARQGGLNPKDLEHLMYVLRTTVLP